MAAAESSHRREGLSVQTLVIAAVASAVAAIVTSTFWRGGTIFTAALSPVIIAIVKELLARPIQSDVVRKPLKAASGGVGAVTNRRFERERERGVRVGARAGASYPALPPRRGGRAEDLGAPTPGDRVLGTTPMRTYGTSRRKLRIGVAVATGLVAFAIAFVVLTLPELVFGGSIAGGGRTTLVPGSGRTTTNQSTSPGSSSGSQTSTSTTPQATPPSGSQTSTTTSPLQSPPSQPAPPSGAAPQSGGSSGGQSPPSGGGSSGSGSGSGGASPSG